MMSTETKFRFVKCYRCLKFLPEMPELSIYSCANCGAVIQAKRSRTSSVDSETDSSGSVQQKEVKKASERSLHKDSCEEINVSEGPTSSEIASSSNESFLNRKGKEKLVEIHVEDESRNFQETETDYFQFTDSKRECRSDPSESFGESHVHLYLSSPDQQQFHDDAPSFRRNGWLDKSAASPLSDASSDPGLKSQSPSTTSYYGYDSSESCNDGADEQKPDKSSWRLRRGKEVDYKSTRGILNGDVKVRSHRSRGGSPYNQRDASRLPFAPRDSFPEGTSSCHGFHSSEKLKQMEEPNQMEIMRKIQELEDQLKVISKFPLHRNSPVEDHNTASFHYDHLRVLQRETYSDHQDHHYLSRQSDSRHGGLRELTRYGDQVNRSCLDCYPDDLHCSSQMPLHIKSSRHFSQSDDNGHVISQSLSSHYETRREHSLGGRGIETNLEEEMKRMNLKKTSQTVKKSLLPVGGGAPFVACCFCWELLELPSRPIISKRGYIKLRCGACNKILIYRTHTRIC